MSLRDQDWMFLCVAVFIVLLIAAWIISSRLLKWKQRTIELKNNKDYEECYQVAHEMLIVPISSAVIIFTFLMWIGVLK